MSQFDCEKITSVIFSLEELTPRVDLAINKFEPEDGVVAMEEASKLLGPFSIAGRIGRGSYDFLVSKIGGVEALRQRTVVLETGGMTHERILQGLANHNILSYVQGFIRQIIQSDEFKFHLNFPIKMQLIRLKQSELGLDENSSPDEVYDKMKGFGLRFCPPEAVLSLLVNNINMAESKSYCRATMEPMNMGDKFPEIINIGAPDLGASVSGGWFKTNDKWEVGSGLIFCIPGYREWDDESI